MLVNPSYLVTFLVNVRKHFAILMAGVNKRSYSCPVYHFYKKVFFSAEHMGGKALSHAGGLLWIAGSYR